MGAAISEFTGQKGSKKDQTADVIVIGGGASGMMAALTAAEAGASVLLLEKNEKLGKFISASVSGYGKGLPQGQDGWFKKAELSGGPIFDVHTHMADALMWFFGKPESISSIGNYNDGTRYTAITSNIAYSNGTFVNSIGNWSVASRKHNPGRTLRLDFENGYIIKDNLQFVEVDREDNVKDLTNPEAQNPFVKEIRYFAECVANNKAVSVCPPEETAEVIRYILTEIKSADNKGEKILF